MFILSPNMNFKTTGSPEEIARHHEVALASKLLAIEYLRSPEYGSDWVREGLDMVSDESSADPSDDAVSGQLENISIAHDEIMAQFSLQVLLDLAMYANLMNSHGMLTETQKETILNYKDLIDEFLPDTPEARLSFA